MHSINSELNDKYRTILGLRFFIGPAQEAVRLGARGGLVVVPSAPVLVALEKDDVLREALLDADLAITDSALMVLMWRIIAREKIARVSGLTYLRLFLQEPEVRQAGAVLWVMPSTDSQGKNLEWLRSQGLELSEQDSYIAPFYPAGAIEDPGLVALIKQRKPKHIIICVGGGTQERLGLMLKQALPYRPGIHCIGAAIGFLSGEQVRIPPWADRLFLGWLLRCLSAPDRFIPRYLKAWRLVSLMLRYATNLPLQAGGKG